MSETEKPLFIYSFLFSYTITFALLDLVFFQQHTFQDTTRTLESRHRSFALPCRRTLKKAA